jgi:hypothetical protein
MLRNTPTALAGLVAAVFLSAPLTAQERPHAFTGAEIITVAGANIPDGVLFVHQGRISAVGPAG